jgi:hypothetical protein
MRKLLIPSVLVFSLILLPQISHAQSIQDRVMGLFRYFQGSGLAAVKKAPTNISQSSLAPVSGDGITLSSDANVSWSGTDPENLTIFSGTVTFTANAGAYHTNLRVSAQGGQAIFQVPNTLNALSLIGGSATIATGTNNVLTTKNLTITGSSYLDITNGGLIVDYDPNFSPITTIRGYLLTGRGCTTICGAQWVGNGIRSSSAAALNAQNADHFSVGYAENDHVLVPGPYGAVRPFMNQIPDQTALLIRFTSAADVNLDGKVGDDDVTLIGVFYDNVTSGKYWHDGDIDYSGVVDDNDVTLLGAFYNEAIAANELVAQPSSSSISLYWSKILSGTMTVEKKTGTGNFQTLTTTANSFYTDSAVTPGTTYTYHVRQNNQYSNDVQVKVPQAQTNCGTLCVPALSSKPGAPYTIYLDFDGDASTTFNAFRNIPPNPAYESCINNSDGTHTACYDTSTFSTTELANINLIWTRVAEKFSPFNINVTTVDPGYPYRDKVALHAIIGGDGAWFNHGNSSITTGSQAFYDPAWDNVAYMFSDTGVAPSTVAESLTQAIGFTFGLTQQNYGLPQIDTQGVTGPIMGGGTGGITRGMWFEGTSTISNTTGFIIQNDASYIANGGYASTTYNWSGVGFRADDYGNTIQTATPITLNNAITGIITPITDTDYFSFTTAGGSITLKANVPDPQKNGPMLDPIITLYNSSGQQLAQADVPYTRTLPIYAGDTITQNLSAGTYYVAIKGHGLVQEYNGTINIGKAVDIGSYTVTVTAP